MPSGHIRQPPSAPCPFIQNTNTANASAKRPSYCFAGASTKSVTEIASSLSFTEFDWPPAFAFSQRRMQVNPPHHQFSHTNHLCLHHTAGVFFCRSWLPNFNAAFASVFDVLILPLQAIHMEIMSFLHRSTVRLGLNATCIGTFPTTARNMILLLADFRSLHLSLTCVRSDVHETPRSKKHVRLTELASTLQSAGGARCSAQGTWPGAVTVHVRFPEWGEKWRVSCVVEIKQGLGFRGNAWLGQRGREIISLLCGLWSGFEKMYDSSLPGKWSCHVRP